MKANEWRIGNYIYNYINGYRCLCKVNSIDINGIRVWDFIKEVKDDTNQSYTYETFPIPLTEEWLIKFGLNETKDQDLFRVNYVNYHKGSNTFSYCIDYYFSEEGYVENMFKEIKYVHELQNLYFALTNEELTIKENEATKELEGNNG